jgi:hypothetical protein
MGKLHILREGGGGACTEKSGKKMTSVVHECPHDETPKTRSRCLNLPLHLLISHITTYPHPRSKAQESSEAPIYYLRLNQRDSLDDELSQA